MNICLRHKKNVLNENNINKFNKLGIQNKNEISNKYFLCKFCGVLIDEHEEVIFL